MSEWDVLSFSEKMQWQGGIGHTIKQILPRLAQSRKVVDFDPPIEWRRAIRCPAKLTKVGHNLWHFEWGRLFPLIRRPHTAAAALRFLRGILVRYLCIRLGIGDHIYLVWNPCQAPVVLGLPPRFTVYYAYDLFEQWHYDREEWKKETIINEERLARISEVGIGVTEVIAETLRQRGCRRTHVVPNGVEYFKFAHCGQCREPEDIAAIPRPRLGYVGGLSEYTSFRTLYEVATRRPDWHLLLVGPARGMTSEQREELNRLMNLPNVYMLGLKPYEVIENYMHGLDVGLAAFEMDRGGAFGGSSLKVYEYLAAGLPVVASPIPGVASLVDTVRIASSPEEWVYQIEQALEDNTPDLRRQRQELAKHHSWDERARYVVSIIETAYQEWRQSR